MAVEGTSAFLSPCLQTIPARPAPLRSPQSPRAQRRLSPAPGTHPTAASSTGGLLLPGIAAHGPHSAAPAPSPLPTEPWATGNKLCQPLSARSLQGCHSWLAAVHWGWWQAVLPGEGFYPRKRWREMTGKGQGAVAWRHQLEPQEDLQQMPPEGDRYWAVLRAAIPLTAPWAAAAPAACSGQQRGTA